MIDLQDYIDRADTPEKKKILAEQWKLAVNEGYIYCPCGQARGLVKAFRCLYCGVWFCQPCAEQHFGQTVKEWIVSKRKEARAQVETDLRNVAIADSLA